MGTTDAFRPQPGRAVGSHYEPGSLLDVLGVAAVVLDEDGRIVLWSPQAEDLFGWTASEALGEYAARLMVAEEHLGEVLELFAKVMGGGGNWAGVFPVRHKDGTTRLLEFRNMRLEDKDGRAYALGIATDQAVLRDVERDLALSLRLVAQSPIGLAVLDPDLRFVMVNPALERMHGLPARAHIGRSVREAMPFVDAEQAEADMRRVLATGAPVVDKFVEGPVADPAVGRRARLVSVYRLEDPAGRTLGLATSVVDVTDRQRAAEEARRRLALIADASVLIGTTLDLDQTARELAEVVVPDLADVAAVDVLDTALHDNTAPTDPCTAVFRALAVASADSGDVGDAVRDAVRAADPPGEIAQYDADRLVTRCVNTGRPVHLPRVTPEDLPRIARDEAAAELLRRAGLRSYMAVPLIARGEVLGALDLKRIHHPEPFDEDDVVLAGELAARAAVCIDNARWFQRERQTALALQRSLLPQRPQNLVGLEVAYRYQPAGSAGQVGGDWFDVIAQGDAVSALVVGDVMGSGINAAAAMGQLRTAARTLSGLGLDPAQVLHHLDRTASGLDQSIATCVYAVYDHRSARCRVATAGHLPPVLMRPDRRPTLLELPTGAPLGVGGVPFESVGVDLAPGDQLVFYTDGLVETRDEAIDTRLEVLVDLLDGPWLDLEATCDMLLERLRDTNEQDDDVALLIARVRTDPV